MKYLSDYVIFDIETTGLSPAQDQIIELAAVKVRDHKVVDTFSSLVNPGVVISEKITGITNITNDMVKNAPKIQSVMKDFLDFIGNDMLVGHNIQKFDMKFIVRDAEKIHRQVNNQVEDTLVMARNYLHGTKHNLGIVAARYGISDEGAHRALNDCLMNQKVYEAMCKEFHIQEAGKVPEHTGIGTSVKSGEQLSFLSQESQTPPKDVPGSEPIKDGRFYCLVAGSRSFEHYGLLKQKLDKMLKNKSDIVIVSGGANGADTLAERYAKEKGYELKVMKADWYRYGKKAGYIRNEQMHRYIAQYKDRGCVCFWDGESRGTRNNFDLCEKYNTPLRIIEYPKILEEIEKQKNMDEMER